MRGHIRKRGNSWCVVIYLGRDRQSGRKRDKWYTHGTRRDAEAHLNQLLTQVQAGGGVPPSRLRLNDYLEDWLQNDIEARVAPTTFQSYKETIQRHVTPALGHLQLSRLSAPASQRYISEKLKAGLSPTTVRYHVAVLGKALRQAIRWSLLARNPMEFVDLPRRRNMEMRVWDEEQVGLFIGEARKSSRYYPLYLTAILTGMREGELLGLRWADVDFLLGSVSIQRSFYRLGKRQLVREPKTRTSRRTILLPPVLIDELKRVLESQKKAKGEMGAQYEDQGLVFCQPNGKPLHAHNITQRDFRRVIARAKVPWIRFHDLRHCHATHLLRAGVNPKVVQERLGHHAAAFTLSTYAHALPGMQEEATRLIAERLLGTPDRKD